jgi:hypothetical protein
MTRAAVPAALAACVALASAPAASAPPAAGVLVPGESLGGIELGMTHAEVRAQWGGRFGVCRGCARTTWYFNDRPFDPKGAGVAFRRGRVAHVFTLWQPDGWRSRDGLELGASRSALEDELLARDERDCNGYTALVAPGAGADTAYYVFRDELWGFGLIRPRADPCL